ncbi:MAG TPA: hypothetical protein VFX28_21975, partial [Methylomirabilota bacterium]|nr:hypothetical protein [Methylomirabilota bacterium]
GRGVAAARGAGAGLLAGVRPGAAIVGGMSRCNGGGTVGAVVCGSILAVGLGIAAAGGTIGALAGALHEAASAEAPSREVGEALKSAAAERNLQEALRESVLEAGPRRTSLAFVPVEPAVQAGDPGPGPAGNTVADTIVEVALKTMRLTREGPGANPPVMLVSTARARLVRAADGRELYRHAVTHRSATRPYEEWAADDGHPLKEALAAASAEMAEEIIDVFFVRSEPAPVAPVQESPREAAATAGVRYQPTLPWSPAASTAQAVTQNACRRQYLEGWADWRDRLPEYRACLAR